ncbi:hypothetical protein A2625_01930 [candidate division WOR-1 bacterium RIFCSPHIGHO2_01_FULL_53_15]|uniref:Uncharacterized protein n=1 Tax=candidate division WOR-1 bacterium RIFCSPHIGHO2_01_FULL_53_15 TaxID=1802564 RepID=A0A1F4Q297_UNCSA|nr:MAG: hypothetical protein A2625_01930 [candidate division WOR-1 bacterium RIFCSPHIGHO2_01_FULL_53_15]OGC13592.1 MAG: hypothetical protein A3D23_06075 [candidate division WOR-1 bacterium RIFCSPHIGHO2_02_FULL_53_26]
MGTRNEWQTQHFLMEITSYRRNPNYKLQTTKQIQTANKKLQNKNEAMGGKIGRKRGTAAAEEDEDRKTAGDGVAHGEERAPRGAVKESSQTTGGRNESARAGKQTGNDGMAGRAGRDRAPNDLTAGGEKARSAQQPLDAARGKPPAPAEQRGQTHQRPTRRPRQHRSPDQPGERQARKQAGRKKQAESGNRRRQRDEPQETTSQQKYSGSR